MADRTGTFYAADEAINGYGGELLCGDGASPETFQSVAFVERIGFGEMSTEKIRTTHLRSPDAHHEYRPGLRDSGPFSIMLSAYVPSEESHSYAGGGSGSFTSALKGGLVGKWTERVARNWIIRLFDGSPATELPFNGFISKFQPSEIDGSTILKATVEIQPTRSFSAELP